jgi:DNA-binding transcriptional LysR family regulator
MGRQMHSSGEQVNVAGVYALELRRLRYFVAVAEEMHFGRAADRLGIAQPPLSRQIARLESAVSAQLVDRSHSQIRLTQAGQVLFARARELMRRVEEIREEVARLGSGKAGLLRVGFVGSATYGVLPPLIKSFRAEYPDIDLALSAMNNAALKQALVERHIDLAIARPSIDDDDVVSQRLQEEPLILALPDQLVGDEERPLELASLRDQTFVLYPEAPRPSFADHVLGVCQAAGFRPTNLAMAMDYQTAISLVSVGVGISIVPQSVATTRRAGVAYRPYVGPNPGTALSVNYRIDNQSPQLWSFLEVARRYARSAGPPRRNAAA